ncbi:MAG: hypothetical protein QY326_07995 [Bdellovibrionota bacterium]|nr:MAG: hypothetical protein QY326_07995 [Bdellovibrionota bacterium]
MRHCCWTLKLLASLLGLIALSGCVVKAYSGATRPPEEISEVTLRSSGDAIVEGITIDGQSHHAWSDNYQLLPGKHDISIRYRHEGSPTNCFGGYCDSAIQYGSCSGTITTLPGRPYLVTIKHTHGYVTASALAKSYFDLTVRPDEQSAGHIACAVDNTFDRVVPDPTQVR